jgi:hypothetical protein
MFEFFPCTRQLWLVDVGYALWNSLSKLSKGLWHLRLVHLVFYMTSTATVITRGMCTTFCEVYQGTMLEP